tara:strand:+ start:3042 stop:3314 length:273 start_codon:yes stop_codon:yes gene_type:complete
MILKEVKVGNMAKQTYVIYKKNKDNLNFYAMVRPSTNTFNGAINVIAKAESGYVRGKVANRHATGKKPIKMKGNYFVLNTKTMRGKLIKK